MVLASPPCSRSWPTWSAPTRARSRHRVRPPGRSPTCPRMPACEAFSGGWQMRIALAKMLVRKPGLLLLDEPTNHLDLAACEWLEGYLVDYPGSILVVSHDRYFLDRVTTRTIELADGVATDYRGNYSHYLTESARRRAEHKAAYERQQKYIARQVAFINATKANAARAALAKSRERELEKLE